MELRILGSNGHLQENLSDENQPAGKQQFTFYIRLEDGSFLLELRINGVAKYAKVEIVK